MFNLYVYNSTVYIPGTQEARGESASLGTWVTDGCKLPWGYWGLNLSLEEEQVPLAAEPSFQLQPRYLSLTNLHKACWVKDKLTAVVQPSKMWRCLEKVTFFLGTNILNKIGSALTFSLPPRPHKGVGKA